MNISQHLISMTRRSMHRNDGITVIEVLTSLVVATIVFGVLVLIPFAVKQSQLGLDQDAAGIVAANAVEDLQIYGFTRVSDNGNLQFRGQRINLDDAGNVTPNSYAIPAFNTTLPTPAVGGVPSMPLGVYATPLGIGGASGVPPQVIHFDPAAVAEIGFPVAGNIVDPDFLTGLLPPLDADGYDLDQHRVTVATAQSGGLFAFGGTTFNDVLRRPEIVKIFRSFDDQSYSDVNLQSVEVR